MKLLVLGASDIFSRRVASNLPALGLAGVEIVSRGGRRPALPPELSVVWRDDAEAALAHSPAEAVYVTTENSRHAALVQAALASGRHVVVDKPAFLTLAEAEAAAELAAQKNLTLAEATVWADHPRIKALLAAFAAVGSAPTRVSAVFSFPPLPPGNFRHVAALGGGALADLGAYAASPGRVLFGCQPDTVDCHILSRGPEVETAFVCQMTYPGGRGFTGTFGFDTGYANRLDVLGPNLAASLDRAFTPPPGAALELACNTPTGCTVEIIPPADAFARFFARALAAMAHGHDPALAGALIVDARVRARLSE